MEGELCSVFPGLPHLQRELTACETAARAVKATEKMTACLASHVSSL